MSIRPKLAFVLIGVCVFAAGMIWATQYVTHRREPFRMTLKLADGRTFVQFAQTDRGLVSPEFPVDLDLDATRVVDLRSDAMAIPGCTIEFSDTTLLPGRFQIRIGRRVFDVMQRGIYVGTAEYAWKPD